MVWPTRGDWLLLVTVTAHGLCFLPRSRHPPPILRTLPKPFTLTRPLNHGLKSRINTSVCMLANRYPLLFPAIYHHAHSLVYRSPFSCCLPRTFTAIFTYSFVAILTCSFVTTCARPHMNTRAKNKTAHPAVPITTPARLLATGITKSQSKRPRKKQTKDQQIAALREDLRMAQELLQVIPTLFSFSFTLFTISPQNHPASAENAGGAMPELPDDGGDTEPATEDEEEEALTTGRKRAAKRPAGTGIKCMFLLKLGILTAF